MGIKNLFDQIPVTIVNQVFSQKRLLTHHLLTDILGILISGLLQAAIMFSGL